MFTLQLTCVIISSPTDSFNWSKGQFNICDFSLEHVKSRAASVGDKLVSSNFDGTASRGFADISDCETAVCILPGTELAFEDNIKTRVVNWSTGTVTEDVADYKVARFRQINKQHNYMHHDALEYPDGKSVLLHDLATGQYATVLQLPAAPKTEAEVQEQSRLEVVA